MKKIFLQEYEKYWVLADQVTVSGAAFVTNLVLARVLGITNFGKFTSIVMLQLFLLSITMSLSSQLYQVLFLRLEEKEKQLLTTGLFYQQLFGSLGLILLTLILNQLFPVFFSQVLSIPSNLSSLWPILAITFTIFTDFLRRALITQGKARFALLIDMIDNFLQIVLIAVCLYMKVLDIKMAWLCIALAYIPAIIVGIYLLAPHTISSECFRFTWKQQKDKSSWLLGTSLLQWGSGYFFVVAAGWWLGAAALGALRLAQYVFGLLNLLLQAVENYALPLASRGIQKGKYWYLLLKKCILLIVPFLIIIGIFAKQILLFAGGNEFASYTFVMYGLIVVYLAITIGYPIRIAIRSMHMNKDYFVAYILSVSVSILCAPWLLQHWQLYGVLAGLLLSQVINSGYWLIVLFHKKNFIWKSAI
ncbi:lipopolysaccharide biosynthesis protein [Chitinophaga sancti]|uniref:Membrane protein involved in the export of O-antigen and teichoic acid n=1 Tax=Chitinophaga sancti TaxID=1004 RepID=A0A1K1RU70_9BACT|nr:oligosaccharide flippase family protein [Chitinophaga sancti]WQD62349.1 oligosaccharide flippase family protein [Chitinophaga sancti]WQG92082.1 oligosaccharide flippase family protein [Chitinophaga sancti]SFW75787.1 Membrane protein involved in the export of O-antigen and teichoic acid [Chitinophaga sancti]